VRYCSPARRLLAPSRRPAQECQAAGEASQTDYRRGDRDQAIDLLKAASSRLAAAKSMKFTAVISYEAPSRFGPPLVYTTKNEVDDAAAPTN